jgi:hypothetical protein
LYHPDEEGSGLDVEWDETKRREVIKRRGVDILHAALKGRC